MQPQNEALAREERLAAARKTLSKYQDRIKELKTTTPPASTQLNTNLPQEDAEYEEDPETRAQHALEAARGLKDSLSSSSASTTTNSSQFSFLGDNHAHRTEPVRGDAVNNSDVLEAAIDFDENSAIRAKSKNNYNSHAVEDVMSKTDSRHSFAAVTDNVAASRTSVVTEEELRRINLMYKQICVQLEQKAQEEEQLRSRIDCLTTQLDEKTNELSTLNETLNELLPVATATEKVDKGNPADSESPIVSDALRKLEIAETENRALQDQCSEWMEKYNQLQTSFHEMQRQNMLREEEIGQQLADMQRLLIKQGQESKQHILEPQVESKIANLSDKLASAEAYIQTLVQERGLMQESVAESVHNQTALRAQILDLQSRNARMEAEKYTMYEQMLKQATVSEQNDAAEDADKYSVIVEQLSAAFHAAEAKLSRLDKDFAELVAHHKNMLSSKTEQSPSLQQQQAISLHTNTLQSSQFTPALLEDLLRSKFVRMTNENADLRLQLDDKEDQMELLRSECDTVIDYINVYQMQKLKLAEREARVSELESQVKNQLERAVEYINVADSRLLELVSNVRQAQLYNDAKGPSFGTPSVPSANEYTSSDAFAENEKRHLAVLFTNILNSVGQILDDLHRIKGAEIDALNQVLVQRRMYHAHDVDNKADDSMPKSAGTKQPLLPRPPTHSDASRQTFVPTSSRSTDPKEQITSGIRSGNSGGNYSPSLINARNSMCSINNAVVAYDGPVISI